MNSLADLVALIDQALAPGFDVAAAEARLGPVGRWVGEVAYVKDIEPGLRESAIETLGGRYTGVRSTLHPPLEVPWSDLEQALGRPKELVEEVDNFTGRVSYRFDREAPSGGRGVVYLHAKRAEDPARIQTIIVRPERLTSDIGG